MPPRLLRGLVPPVLLACAIAGLLVCYWVADLLQMLGALTVPWLATALAIQLILVGIPTLLLARAEGLARVSISQYLRDSLLLWAAAVLTAAGLQGDWGHFTGMVRGLFAPMGAAVVANAAALWVHARTFQRPEA